MGGRHLLEAMQTNTTVTSIDLVSCSPAILQSHGNHLFRRTRPTSAKAFKPTLKL